MFKIMKPKCDKMVLKHENELPLWCPSFIFPDRSHNGPNKMAHMKGLRATYAEKCPIQCRTHQSTINVPGVIFFDGFLFLTWPSGRVTMIEIRNMELTFLKKAPDICKNGKPIERNQWKESIFISWYFTYLKLIRSELSHLEMNFIFLVSECDFWGNIEVNSPSFWHRGYFDLGKKRISKHCMF